MPVPTPRTLRNLVVQVECLGCNLPTSLDLIVGLDKYSFPAGSLGPTPVVCHVIVSNSTAGTGSCSNTTSTASFATGDGMILEVGIPATTPTGSLGQFFIRWAFEAV